VRPVLVSRLQGWKNHDFKKIKEIRFFLFKSDFFLNSYFCAKVLPTFETSLSAKSHKLGGRHASAISGTHAFDYIGIRHK